MENFIKGENYTIFNGDCVDVMANQIEENSFDFSVFSLPFADLYTYSSKTEDQGNCRDNSLNHDDVENKGEFFYTWAITAKQLYRVMKPGTVVAVHLANLIATNVNHGYVGIRDFYSMVRAGMCRAGFNMFGEFVIKKNQQAVSIRTHASTLTMATHTRDTSKLSPCYNDYVVTFKKPGDREKPVSPPRFDKDTWIHWASGIWTDIKESDTLNVRGTKENDREKHVCPLQLTVIDRLTKMYCNEGDTCFSPYGGIGSEPYTFLKNGQKAVAIELKDSYFNQMHRNLESLVAEQKEKEQSDEQMDLESLIAEVK